MSPAFFAGIKQCMDALEGRRSASRRRRAVGTWSEGTPALGTLSIATWAFAGPMDGI